TDFDPEGAYSVPYTWCIVGIVYNTKYITEEEASTWDILWNEKYSGKVLMFGNSRDAFGIALKRLGYSLNSENPDEIEEAADTLTKQKEVNQAYAMDQTFDKMANENAWAAPYYAGDCVTMMDRNEDLAFAYPVEGVNQFIDSICIPKGTSNKEAAEAFINFLCETDIAVANCEYISYFTPHMAAFEELGIMDERIYPSDEVLEKSEAFRMLGDEATSLMEVLWLRVRATSSFDSTIYPLAIILLLGLVIFLILYVIRKHRKDRMDYYQ
ncbi:MAG: extracellular solute-binding protein, partial [Clostridia bacterium]|nr:extracellular solute-binding protein [Clostridia bacterium]